VRVQLQQLTGDDSAAEFSNSLLQLRNGNLMIDGNGNTELPLGTYVNNRKELYEAIFPYLTDTILNTELALEKSNFGHKNDGVHFINIMLARTLTGEHRIYASVETVVDEDEAVNQPVEFSKSLTPTRLPHHILKFTVGFRSCY